MFHFSTLLTILSNYGVPHSKPDDHPDSPSVILSELENEPYLGTNHNELYNMWNGEFNANELEAEED
jgi:hypothetical protein